MTAVNLRWARENRERSNTIKNSWRARNLEKVKEIEAARREDKNAYYREWAKTDRGRAVRKANQYQRDARRRGDFSDVHHWNVRALVETETNCFLCNVEFTRKDPLLGSYVNIDHILPINVGGLHIRRNLRTICRDCNIRRPKDGSDLDDLAARKNEAGLLRSWTTPVVAVHHTCSVHPKYQGSRPPRNSRQFPKGCFGCWIIWSIKESEETRLMELFLRENLAKNTEDSKS